MTELIEHFLRRLGFPPNDADCDIRGRAQSSAGRLT